MDEWIKEPSPDCSSTASVVLPATLTGTFALQLIPGGNYYFEGEIEL